MSCQRKVLYKDTLIYLKAAKRKQRGNEFSNGNGGTSCGACLKVEG